MPFKLFLISLLTIIFAITSYSCNEKEGIPLKDAKDEKLATKIARSENFKEQQKILSEILATYSGDTSKIIGISAKALREKIKHLKDNPYFTSKEKEDSIVRMQAQRASKHSIKPEILALVKKSAAFSKKVNEEFPELKGMTVEKRKSVIKRAFVINGIKTRKTT